MKKLFICLFAGFAMASCQHKELCYDHPHTVQVQVVFDWEDAASSPMSLYLFPCAGGQSLRYDFLEAAGGTIRVPPGRYDALCLNNDTEGVEYRNAEEWETFEVTTRTTELLAGLGASGVYASAPPQAGGTEDERIAQSPAMLWSDSARGVELNDAQRRITLHPALSVSAYTFEIRNAEHLEEVTALSGSLSSMSGGLLAGEKLLTGELVTVPFAADVFTARALVSGSFRVFGHCPAEANRHTLTIYAILSDGSKWYYTYDVTEQIHTAPNPRQVHIRLDGLPLPAPEPGGGFDPSVGDWQEVNVDIEM